jgi:DNA-binding MarR family transcriptional regulator
MPRTSTKAKGAARRVEAEYRLEDQVGFLLRRAYQRASSNLIDRIGGYDLTAPQFATLARLHERGVLSQNLLGRLVAMEPANIRDVVLRLKKRGLVTTRPSPVDGRLILVGLSAAGKSLVAKLLPIEIECTARTLARFSADERTLLYEMLGRLADDE